MQSFEALMERLIFWSRWLLLPFYLGLCLALVAYFVSFAGELVSVFQNIGVWSKNDMLLSVLKLVDAVLVASLVVMVVISGYENMISRLDIDAERHGISWLGKLDTGTLKVKVAASIVAISSIHLLQAFLNVQSLSNENLMWLVIIHLTFVASAMLLAFLDRMAAAKGN
ncbi:uncharacterized protein (TIGR00645 family) [Dongia mobilis]|uniref:UPF0114 protein A8950_2471 n=1 Tax=Dongia mobilis TaxID=578943 RepID=A0A4R6WS15_9PROT|nr:TIGR00645 family protein [Dongia mobilis]TDQ81403.1 uncharacterized protein (TIGR00645 family) [Dongia mobilis]